MDHKTLKVNDIVMVIKEHSSLKIGMTIKISSIHSAGNGNGSVIDPAGSQFPAGSVIAFTLAMVALVTRTKRAEIMEVQADQLFKDANDAADKARALKAEARRLREFESDEEELADLLVNIQDSKGSRATRVTKLAAILKGRIKTNHL